ALLRGQVAVDPRGARRLLAQAVADLDGDPKLTAPATATVALRAVAEVPPEDPRPWLQRAAPAAPVVDRGAGQGGTDGIRRAQPLLHRLRPGSGAPRRGSRDRPD